MPLRCSIRLGEYHDSITLMQAAQKLTGLPGVRDAAVVMATEANKALLRQAGLLTPDVESATPSDLIIAVLADTTDAALTGLEAADSYLRERPKASAASVTAPPRTVRAAVRAQPQSNLAVISVTGQYAAGEAWEALKSGLHVLLFSDNVSLADEIALKRYAVQHGLLMMGPGCGTAILNGLALGFANVVPRGPIGLVAAAGTGMQEVTTLLAKLGVGISQGIGTGGRDLHQEVGAMMMLAGLQALQADAETRVIVLISKPPAPAIAQRVINQVQASDKPAVVCFLGSQPGSLQARRAVSTRTLQEAAYLAAAAAEGAGAAAARARLGQECQELQARAVELRQRLRPGQKYVRGLFSGGTLNAEALVIWRDLIGDVCSNAPLDPPLKLQDSARCTGHCTLDLGEEEFTVGRPHPMIDNDLRIRRLLQEAADPEVAAIVLDVVLGYGAHPDPGSELGPAIRQAREIAAEDGRDLIVITSVTGTQDDPQNLQRQVEALEAAGAVVCSCNAAVAQLAAFIADEGLAIRDEKRPSMTLGSERSTHHSSLITHYSLLGTPLSVVNVGLRAFAESVQSQGARVTDVDWRPPRVPKLQFTRSGVDMDAANAEAVKRIMEGRPLLAGMGIARQVMPGFHNRLILHAGPPITWERMCGPLRGAVMGALVYEGLARDEEEAARLAGSGEVEFAPCHHYHAVGPMAGIISPSMPVFMVRNETFGNVAYATQNEGLGRVLRYGAYGPDVYERLHWMADELYPTLRAAIDSIAGGIDLRVLISQALHMGDECHNRNRAGTSLFLRAITPAILRSCPDRERAARVFEFIERNDHFFLNLSMAAGKAMLEPAEGIEGATVLTTMARNGTDFGIRMACMPEHWFVAPAAMVQGLYLPGFSAEEANPDIGDSTITETAGFGAFAMAGAPAIARFVGGTPEDALNTTLEMYEICFAEHEHLTIPPLNFRGTPLGIDVRKIAETGILPRLNTGIAHKKPGIGMVGAGVLRAPEKCFIEAYRALQIAA